jgi:hypothetical protein
MDSNPIVNANSPGHSEEIIAEQRTIYVRGDKLLVARISIDDYYVSIPSICDALELNTKGQIQRIKRSADLFSHYHLLLMETIGGRQKISCINIKGIEHWLSGLRSKHLSPTQAQKNLFFQQELSNWIVRIFLEQPEAEKTQEPIKEPLVLVIPQPQQHHQTVELVNEIANQEKMLTILDSLPAPEVSSHITTTVSPVDATLREASFASEDLWEIEANMHTPIFYSSNMLQMYLGTPKSPLRVNEAQEKIRQLSGGTVLTARIAMGLWNMRRHDNRLSLNGSVAVRLDEILAWRGIQKHIRNAYGNPNTSTRARTDGYRAEQRQQVLNDFELLSSCCVRGQCTIEIKPNKKETFYIDGPYWRYSIVTKVNLLNEREVIGIFLSPGDWILTSEIYTSNFLADIDQKIFRLHPQSEQHELRIALYLVERWRQQQQNPIEMQHLLDESMIIVNTKNIARFINRIEDALNKLWEYGILGEPARCLSQIDKNKTRWARDWLSSQWSLTPPPYNPKSYPQQQLLITNNPENSETIPKWGDDANLKL